MLLSQSILLRIKKAARNNYILLIILFLFGIIYAYLSIRRHVLFQSHAYDLGIYDQIVWLYSRFKIPLSSIRGIILLGDHFHPILLLFVPFYWIWSDPRMLLSVQALLVVLSAVPIYLIAEKKFGNRLFSLMLATAYLMFFGIQSAIGFDFHVATISVFFLSWLLYFYEVGHKKLLWLFIILTLCCKEDMALLIAMLGIYDFFIKKQRLRGSLITLLSLLTMTFFSGLLVHYLILNITIRA